MLVSICMLSIDRFQMMKHCLETAIERLGIDRNQIELLTLDNGSSDPRNKEYLRSVSNHFISHPKNIGVSAGFNELFRKSTGKYICTIGNDILLEQNWLSDLIKSQVRLPEGGISSIYCVLNKGTYNESRDVYVPENGIVYGVSLWKRTLMDKIGGFDERLAGYGCEDSQFAYRSLMTGHLNYYIPNQSSYHLGEDLNLDSEYRKSKNENLMRNAKKLRETLEHMQKINFYKIKL